MYTGNEIKYIKKYNKDVVITTNIRLHFSYNSVRFKNTYHLLREAAAYDEAAVAENKKKILGEKKQFMGGCPGSRLQTFERNQDSGKFIPWQVTIILTDGKIAEVYN